MMRVAATVKLGSVLATVALAGCVTLQTVAPYAAPARIVYCASSPEARQELREMFGLPHIIWCHSDYTRAQVEAAAAELGIEPPVMDPISTDDTDTDETDTDDEADDDIADH